MIEITQVEVLPGYRLHLSFNNGIQGTIDLSEWVGKGVFVLWKDERFFERVRIGSFGELVWDDQIDLCPDALYLKMTGEEPQNLFPNLQKWMSYA